MARKIKKTRPRQQEIVKTIRGIWSSLESHLDYTIPGFVERRWAKCPHCGGRRHDVECVIEYAEMILTLAKQLK